MKHHRRAGLATLLTIGAVTTFAPAAQAGFGVSEADFEAGTCASAEPSCTYKSPKSVFYTQAAGHPPWGITKFVLNHNGSGVPEGAPLKRIRVDVPPGLAANPQALPTCARAQFEANSCPGDSQVGTTELEAVLEAVPGVPVVLPPLSGTVYNLDTPPGLPLDFGINVAPAGELITPVHLFLEGHVDWAGDYHEYFEINDIPREAEALGLVKAPLTVLMSKLNFNGQAGIGNFLTLPSVCSSSTVSHLEVESWMRRNLSDRDPHPGRRGRLRQSPLLTLGDDQRGHGNGTVRRPDGVTTVVQVPQKAHKQEINTSDIREAHVTLPEGLTLNPAAAHGLAACSPAQIGIGTTAPVACPADSRVGTVTIETNLPPKTLTGGVYLGSPGAGAITGPPYTIYLDAESSANVSVRLQGSLTPNPSTGRLEATFADNPQLPFSELT